MALFGDEERFRLAIYNRGPSHNVYTTKGSYQTLPHVGPGTYYSHNNESMRCGWSPQALRFCKREPMSPAGHKSRAATSAISGLEKFGFGTDGNVTPGPGQYTSPSWSEFPVPNSYNSRPQSAPRQRNANFMSQSHRLHPAITGTLGNGYIVEKKPENSTGPGQYNIKGTMGSSKSFNMRAQSKNLRASTPLNSTSSSFLKTPGSTTKSIKSTSSSIKSNKESTNSLFENKSTTARSKRPSSANAANRKKDTTSSTDGELPYVQHQPRKSLDLQHQHHYQNHHQQQQDQDQQQQQQQHGNNYDDSNYVVQDAYEIPDTY